MADEAQARAAGDSDLACSIEALRQGVTTTIVESQNQALRGLLASSAVLRPEHVRSLTPTRAEFDALIARLAAAEAEIETLKKGRGPEAQGVI